MSFTRWRIPMTVYNDYRYPDPPSEFLTAVWEYLHERNVPVEVLHADHIQVNRNKHQMVLMLDRLEGHIVNIKTNLMDGRITEDYNFDLNCPDSLQQIYEFVMSKRRR